MSEFRTIRELCSVVVDCPHSTPKWTANGKIVIRNNNIKHGRIDFSSPSYTNDEHFAQRIKRAKPQPGDIIITREAPIGDVGMIPENTECCLGQRMVLLRANQSVCDNFYLLYSLQSLYVQHQISWSEGTGTTVSNLRIPHLEQIQIPYLPLEQQAKISSVLRALEEKIENNRRLNDNLQQQLTAIYKSWYQDFSLVNDTELVETAYGTIPKGWHYVLLGDLCQSISVTHKFDKNALIFLNTGDVEDGRFLHSNLMAVKEMPGQAKKTIAPGDILYSEIRPINRHFAYVNFPSDDYVVSTKLMIIRAKNFDTRRLYHYLTSENVLNELQLQAESRSGTFPQIRFENVSKLPILIADEQTESEFVKILHTVFDQIEQLNRENKQLSELRDTLLPKLVSGEIDVSDIQI